MKNQELIKYLSKFNLNSEVSVIIANVSAREKHNIIEEIVITDSDHPTLCYNIEDGEGIDEEERAAVEEAEMQVDAS